MFRLIIFTLIGLFAVVMLHTTPEIATSRHAPAAMTRGGAPLADGRAGEAGRDGSLARLAFERAGTAAGPGAEARQDPEDGDGAGAEVSGAEASGAHQWIEIRDASGRRSFLSTRNAALAAH